ncbi:MAG: signal peptidase I [Coriobacteriia bacterium]|nr:signal peptidase I [Coriobacteriia bacterium]
MSDDRSYPLEEQRPPSFARWAGELLLMVGIAFVLAMGIRTYIVMPYTIPSGSMIPTIQIDERVLVNKFIYRFQDPRPGDIVVLDDPMGGPIPLIKRVIAVAGQEVDINDGMVDVNGIPLVEPYTHGAITEMGGVNVPSVIPEGQIWLMGDNRTNSTDSRFFGPRPLSSVHGRAFLRIWPLSRIETL